jgi:hypothetical protein
MLGGGTMGIEDSIYERIKTGSSFSLSELHALVDQNTDLTVWGAVREVLRSAYARISPLPDMQFNCEFIVRYLLRVIHEPPTSEQLLSCYEAAHELAECCKHWASKLPLTNEVLRFLAAEIASAYVRAQEPEQLCLLNGFLEHALEAESVRPYFESWKLDHELAHAWELAMEWGVYHGDPAE